MSKWEFNSKVFLQQLIAYFFLLNGLKLLLSLRNIDLLKVLNNGSSLQVTIAEVQVLYPNRVPGMIISDFIFFNTIVSYCITIIIFLLLLSFSKSKRETFLIFIPSMVLIIFFGQEFWNIVKFLFIEPFTFLDNIYLEVIFSGVVLIILSTLLFSYSNSKKLLNNA